MESVGKRRRRVLIIVENLPVPFDRRVWQESKALRDAGYDVTVLCPTGKGFESRFETLEGIRVHRYRLPLEASGFLGYIAEYIVALCLQFVLATKIFMRHGFDVIHACNPPDNIFLVALPFKLLGVRFLFDHHDICPELYEAKFQKKGLGYHLMLLWEKCTFAIADASLATNNSYRQIAIDRGGMRPENVTVVRSGPDLNRIKYVTPNDTFRNGRSFLVGYVGVMGQQEGIEILLESIAYITQKKKRDDVQFILVGGGTELENLKSLASHLGVADYVNFTGRVPDSELLEALNTADVCVNPDRANDMNDKSTMNKIMEYMALGKPIVQFDLTEGRYSAMSSSLYAKKNDAEDMAEKVLQLLDNIELRKTMGAFGRTRVETELAWEFEVPKLLAAYDRLF